MDYIKHIRTVQYFKQVHTSVHSQQPGNDRTSLSGVYNFQSWEDSTSHMIKRKTTHTASTNCKQQMHKSQEQKQTCSDVGYHWGAVFNQHISNTYVITKSIQTPKSMHTFLPVLARWQGPHRGRAAPSLPSWLSVSLSALRITAQL